MRADECKALSAKYLQCRMNHNLMAQEELNRLGFHKKEEQKQNQQAREETDDRRRRGFIAGTRQPG